MENRYSIRMDRIAPVVLVLVSGLLSGIGILAAPLWFCAPLGLALFIYMVWERSMRASESLQFGTIFGFLTAGAGLLSLWEIVPPDQSANISIHFAAGLLWLVPTIALGAVSIPFAYVSHQSKYVCTAYRHLHVRAPRIRTHVGMDGRNLRKRRKH